MEPSEFVIRARMEGLVRSLRATAAAQHALTAQLSGESRAQVLGQAYMLEEAARYVAAILTDHPPRDGGDDASR
jgi:hypothetical protein